MVKHLLFGPCSPVCSAAAGAAKPRYDMVIAFMSTKTTRASGMQQPPPPRSVECIQRRYFGVKRHSAPPPQHYHQRSPIRPQYPVSTQAQAQVQAQAQIRQRRPYHSHFQSVFPTTHEYTHSQTAILSTALEHVPEHGFTLEALTLGARDAGFLDVSVQLFSRREFDLVLFWLASRRGLLKGKVEEEEEEGLFDKSRLSVDEKVKVLVMQRLRMNEKIVHRWQDALALMSFPTNVPLSLSELHTLSSDILYLAGDTSVDASWYTKRLSLSTIYASAEFFMTQDASPDFTATEAFVDRRIEDNKVISEKIKNVKQCLRVMAGTAVGLGRSWGMKL